MLTCEIVSARAIILLYNMLIIDSNQAHDTMAMVTITTEDTDQVTDITALR